MEDSKDITVFVKTPTGPKLTLKVNNKSSGIRLKHLILESYLFDLASYRLQFTNKNNDLTTLGCAALHQYGLGENSEVVLSPVSCQSVQIFVKNLEGKTLTYNIALTESVLALKKLVQKVQKIKPQNQRLIWGTQLEDPNSLCYYGLQKQSTIHLVLRLRGGGGNFASILFNNLGQPVHRGFSDDAPNWRIVKNGINFEGCCRNSSCKACDQRVWVPKGYGKFNMNKEVNDCQCPMCGRDISDVNNMGLYLGNCNTEGKMQGKSDKVKKSFIHTDKNNLLTFENKDELVVRWLFLELDVTLL